MTEQEQSDEAHPNVEQRAEKGGENYYAGRDIVQHGLSYTDTRALFLDLFEANFPRLIAEAKVTAEKRSEELFTEFWRKLKQQGSVDSDVLADPGVQADIADALSAYARSGDHDVGEVLADLLAKRARASDSNIRELSVSAALPIAAKLRRCHYNALSLVLLVRRTVFRGFDLNSVLVNLKASTVAVGRELEIGDADVLYMATIGALTIEMGEIDFVSAIRQVYGGLFVKGFTPVTPEQLEMVERLQGTLIKYPDFQVPVPLLRSSEFEPGAFRFNVIRAEDVEIVKQQLDDPSAITFFEQLRQTNTLSNVEIRQKLRDYDPDFEKVIEIWDTRLKHASPTVAGIAIGHANMKRVEPDFGDLSIWIF